MKIKFSKKLLFAAALFNFGVVGLLFYIFVFQKTSAEEMNMRCNTEMLESSLVGSTLPEYKFVDGNGIDSYAKLTDGKVLMIVFLTHCQACLTEFDFLKSNFQKSQSDFKIVAVTSESNAVAARFADEHQLGFPIYVDTEGGLMMKTRIVCTPTLIFMKDGKIEKIKIGKTDNYQEILEGFLL